MRIESDTEVKLTTEGHAVRESSGIFRQKASELFLERNRILGLKKQA